MEDINTLNNKLQSITKRLEDIQTKVLLQDEKIRKCNKDRALMTGESSSLKDRLAEHLSILDAEKEELEGILDATCTYEMEHYSADYSLGLIPSLTLKMCNDYKKFSTRINSRIRDMCQVLKDNNFWIDKQNEATAEQEEFKRTLRETLTNRSAFSSSEEERLRNQLEIEETKLAFLMEQISEAEKAHNPQALSTTEHAHKVTPTADVSRKQPLISSKPFQSPVKAAGNWCTSMTAGATTHSRAFSPPPASAASSVAAKTFSPASNRVLSGDIGTVGDPFEGWADRSSSPRHGPSPPPTQEVVRIAEGKPSRAETEDHHTFLAGPNENTQHSVEQESEEAVDIELDCTTGAHNQKEFGLVEEVRMLGARNNSSVVELTTVRTTVTEVMVQRGPPQHYNQIASHSSYQSYSPPSAPAPFENSHSSSFDDILSSQHPYERHYGGYAGEEVPWFKEHKRRRTVGPTGFYGAGSDHYGSAGAMRGSPYSLQSPPLWPSPTPASSSHPAPAVSAPLHQNNYSNDISSAGMLPTQQRGANSAREPAPAHMTWPDREEGPVSYRDNEDRCAHRSSDTLNHRVHTERANSLVIDLYDTSDSDDSDTGHYPDRYHRRAPDTTAPAGAPSAPQAVTNNRVAAGYSDRLQGGAKSRVELNTDRHKQGHDGQTQGKNLKDRFHTGLALLQQTQVSTLNDLD
eukprot:gene19794-22501_t